MSASCLEDQKRKLKAGIGLKLLEHLQIHCILIGRVIISSILITLSLWLFVRNNEPGIYVKGFTVDGLNNQTNTHGRTLLNYNLSLQNPNLFKSIRYNVLVLFMIPGVVSMSSKAATINFDPEQRNGIWQGPRNSTVLLNHSLNYADPSVGWGLQNLMRLKASQRAIWVWCVMEVEYLAFNRVVGKHQITRRAAIYFDNNGSAFIDPHFGLKLTGKPAL